MITVSEAMAGPHATLVESLTNDLADLADIAAEFAEPEKLGAARAAAAAWSPSRLATTLASGLLEG
jgi:hypothetical protein